MKISFTLTAEFIALNDLLKLAGLCDSGGAGKAMVARGEVKVNGAVELRKTCKIRAKDVVAIGNQQIVVHAAAHQTRSPDHASD